MTGKIEQAAGPGQEMEAVVSELRRALLSQGHTMTGMSEDLGRARSYLGHVLQVEDDGSCSLRVELLLELLRRLDLKPSRFFAQIERKMAAVGEGGDAPELDDAAELAAQLIEEAVARVRRKRQD